MPQPKWKSNDRFITLNLNYDLDGLYDVLHRLCLSMIIGNIRVNSVDSHLRKRCVSLTVLLSVRACVTRTGHALSLSLAHV